MRCCRRPIWPLCSRRGCWRQQQAPHRHRSQRPRAPRPSRWNQPLPASPPSRAQRPSSARQREKAAGQQAWPQQRQPERACRQPWRPRRRASGAPFPGSAADFSCKPAPCRSKRTALTVPANDAAPEWSTGRRQNRDPHAPEACGVVGAHGPAVGSELRRRARRAVGALQTAAARLAHCMHGEHGEHVRCRKARQRDLRNQAMTAREVGRDEYQARAWQREHRPHRHCPATQGP